MQESVESTRGQWGSTRGQVKLLSNALWLPHLVGITPDQSIFHCWGQRSAGVNQCQTEVKLLGNPQWPPNLVTRTTNQSATHC